MANSIWKFVKGYDIKQNDVNDAIIEIISKMLSFMRDELKADYKQYSDIYQMIESKLSTSQSEHMYFWKWMDSHGTDLIQSIVTTPISSEDEELLDLIDYRLYIMEADISSGIPDNMFSSMAGTLTSIANYIITKNEIAVSLGEDTLKNDNTSNELVDELVEDISYDLEQFAQNYIITGQYFESTSDSIFEAIIKEQVITYNATKPILSQNVYMDSLSFLKEDIETYGFELENPAEIQQDFCYYFGRRDESHGTCISNI